MKKWILGIMVWGFFVSQLHVQGESIREYQVYERLFDNMGSSEKALWKEASLEERQTNQGQSIDYPPSSEDIPIPQINEHKSESSEPIIWQGVSEAPTYEVEQKDQVEEVTVNREYFLEDRLKAVEVSQEAKGKIQDSILFQESEEKPLDQKKNNQVERKQIKPIHKLPKVSIKKPFIRIKFSAKSEDMKPSIKKRKWIERQMSYMVFILVVSSYYVGYKRYSLKNSFY